MLIAFNQGCKKGFLSGEQEPWVFRGGLAADLQVTSRNSFMIPFNSTSFLKIFYIHFNSVFYLWKRQMICFCTKVPKHPPVRCTLSARILPPTKKRSTVCVGLCTSLDWEAPAPIWKLPYIPIRTWLETCEHLFLNTRSSIKSFKSFINVWCAQQILGRVCYPFARVVLCCRRWQLPRGLRSCGGRC